MTFLRYVRAHYPLVALLVAVALLSLIPWVHAQLFVGDAFAGVPPSYGDEILYHSQIREVADGNLLYGNPYLYEHRQELPLVIFAGNWIAALPLALGLPMFAALMANFLVWSVILALLLYWFFREFGLRPWHNAAASLLVYLLSFDLMYRPTSRQEVYPVFILFYIGLIRILKEPSLSSALLLGFATGLSFWVFGYLWQSAVITLGLLFAWSWYSRRFALMRATLAACAVGGVLGLPVVLYTAYMSRHPLFWESMARLGLVDSHIPMAEVVYSGGWIGVAIALCALLYWRSSFVREHAAPLCTAVFVVVSGLGLWIMDGSNLFTGKLLETGEHMRRFIVPWMGLALPLCAYLWWYYRSTLNVLSRLMLGALLLVLAFGTASYVREYAFGFMVRSINAQAWQDQQSLAEPLAWLNEEEPEPVVLWVNPHSFLAAHVPSLSRHYLLHIEASIFTLVSDEEIRERYLVSSYFDPVDAEYLKIDLFQFVGRDMKFHTHKTIERGIKVCRILRFWEREACGVPPTALSLIGEELFVSMEQKFKEEIRPNIGEYLKKYHVSYIIKDKVHDANYAPEELGGELVHEGERFAIYKL